MTEKNNAATMSAADAQLDGWPLPASLVARTLLMRSWVALLRRVLSNSGEAAKPAMGDPFAIETKECVVSDCLLSAVVRQNVRLTNRLAEVNEEISSPGADQGSWGNSDDLSERVAQP